MPETRSDLAALLGAGFDAVFHVGEYEIHLWHREREWLAMLCYFGDGISLAASAARTPQEALWSVAGDDPYPGDFAQVPGRLAAFTAALEAAATARAAAEDAARAAA